MPGAVSVTGGELQVRKPRLPKLLPPPKRASAVPAKRTSATASTAATTPDLLSTLRWPSKGQFRPRSGRDEMWGGPTDFSSGNQREDADRVEFTRNLGGAASRRPCADEPNTRAGV